MTRPRTTGYDCNTGEHIDRQMKDEEYAQLIADGWTPGEEATEE